MKKEKKRWKKIENRRKMNKTFESNKVFVKEIHLYKHFISMNLLHQSIQLPKGYKLNYLNIFLGFC